MNYFALFIGFLSSYVLSLQTLVKLLFIKEYDIPAYLVQNLQRYYQDYRKKQPLVTVFPVLSTSYLTDSLFDFIYYDKGFIRISIYEKSKDKDLIFRGKIQVFRFSKLNNEIENKLEEYYEFSRQRKGVYVQIGNHRGITELNDEAMQQLPDKIYLEDFKKRILFKTVDQVVSGERRRAGILLYGPPGTGKTNIVKHLAKLHNATLSVVGTTTSLNDIKSMFLFSSSRNLNIIVFEDFDRVFNKDKKLNEKTDYDFSDLLNIIDGPLSFYTNTLVVFTCNHLDRIDPSLRRPGRLSVNMEISMNSEIQEMALDDVAPNFKEELKPLTKDWTLAMLLELNYITLTKENLEETVKYIEFSYK